jgi:hypothetical protein
MSCALALERLRSVVAATAEKLCFTHCFGQTFLLFQPVARRLLRRSVALQHAAAGCPVDSQIEKKRFTRFPQRANLSKAIQDP